MKPFIRIFVPIGDRTNYQVVVFQSPTGTTEVYDAVTEDLAEALACRLAQKYDCHYKFVPPFDPKGMKHWWTEDGGLREINRVEFVALGGGKFQFNVWSDSVRLFVECGRIAEIGRFLEETAELMGG